MSRPMTQSYVSHDPVYVWHHSVMSHVHTCDITQPWREPETRTHSATKPHSMCSMSHHVRAGMHSYVWNKSEMVGGRNENAFCNRTSFNVFHDSSCVCRDAIICVKWIRHGGRQKREHILQQTLFQCVPWLNMCVLWLIHVCVISPRAVEIWLENNHGCQNFKQVCIESP